MLLELRDLTIQFGGLIALDKVTMNVADKEIVGLIGPNGAGKTTVFNLITGIYKPTGGDILFKDCSIMNVQPYKRTRMGIARTFQNIRLFKQLTVAENLILAMHPSREIRTIEAIFRLPKFYKERKSVMAKASSYLEYVGLLEAKDELAENLPYGKQRELEIVRAISTGAELLLLDEPAAGMNPQETRNLMNFIGRIRSEMHKTILLIEHDMTLVMGISDRVAVLDYGKLIMEGEPSVVQKNPQVIEAYLGKAADE